MTLEIIYLDMISDFYNINDRIPRIFTPLLKFHPCLSEKIFFWSLVFRYRFSEQDLVSSSSSSSSSLNMIQCEKNASNDSREERPGKNGDQNERFEREKCAYEMR